MPRQVDPHDIVKKPFGELVVEEYLYSEPYKKRNNYFYSCVCSCGRKVKTARVYLLTGHKTSCGCKKHAIAKDSRSWTGFGEISGKMWANINNKAVARHLDVTVTLEDVWLLFVKQDGRCALSGTPLTMKSVKVDGVYSRRTASLDRINNDKGYEIGNVQWVHKDINKMRNAFDVSYFVDICHRVSRFCHKGH